MSTNRPRTKPATRKVTVPVLDRTTDLFQEQVHPTLVPPTDRAAAGPPALGQLHVWEQQELERSHAEVFRALDQLVDQAVVLMGHLANPDPAERWRAFDTSHSSWGNLIGRLTEHQARFTAVRDAAHLRDTLARHAADPTPEDGGQ